MITPAERLRPCARAGAALLAAVAGLLLLAGSISHLRPAHVVSASGASSEDVSVNGAAVTGSGAAVAGSVIVSGPCVVDNDCLYSDNYQRTTEGEYEPVGEYSNSGYCLVKNLPAASFLTVHAFHTETMYDFITVDGRMFSGNGLGLNGRVAKAGTIAWHSDRSRTGAGFKICWSPAPPPSPPPPPPAAPAPPSSPPSLAKQLLLALEQGPVATDLEQLLEEHPAALWAGILAQPAREQDVTDTIRAQWTSKFGIPHDDGEREYELCWLEWSNNMPLLFQSLGALGSTPPRPSLDDLDTTCSTCHLTTCLTPHDLTTHLTTCKDLEPPTSCEDIENLFAVGGCAAACTGAVERYIKTSLLAWNVTEQDCSYLLPADVISLLLDTGVDPNTQYMGMTPLALAASNAALPIVEALIAHGADVNAPYEFRSSDGVPHTVSPLALAAMTASGRSESPCHYGQTVLEQERFHARWYRERDYWKSEGLEYLYTDGKSKQQEQEEAANCHESALRTMEALAAAGAELFPSDPAQVTPLQAALWKGGAARFTMPGYLALEGSPLREELVLLHDLSLLRRCRRLLALPEGRDYFAEKVQNTASRDVVDLLVRLSLSHPAPPGRTPMIFESAENGDDHLAQTLIAAGADVNQVLPPPPAGASPHYATLYGEAANASRALGGVPITPLLVAATQAQYQVARRLLAAGAVCPDSLTATWLLHVAARRRFADMAAAVIKAGANVSATEVDLAATAAGEAFPALSATKFGEAYGESGRIARGRSYSSWALLGAHMTPLGQLYALPCGELGWNVSRAAARAAAIGSYANAQWACRWKFMDGVAGRREQRKWKKYLDALSAQHGTGCMYLCENGVDAAAWEWFWTLPPVPAEAAAWDEAMQATVENWDEAGEATEAAVGPDTVARMTPDQRLWLAVEHPGSRYGTLEALKQAVADGADINREQLEDASSMGNLYGGFDSLRERLPVEVLLDPQKVAGVSKSEEEAQSLSMAKFLLQHGASTATLDKSLSYGAVQKYDDVEITAALLKHGAPANSLLHAAVMSNSGDRAKRAEQAELLLDAGADVWDKDSNGWTPLDHAWFKSDRVLKFCKNFLPPTPMDNTPVVDVLKARMGLGDYLGWYFSSSFNLLRHVSNTVASKDLNDAAEAVSTGHNC